jgi:integrase/recombinase XerD
MEIIRKGKLPQPIEVPAAVRDAAQTALCMTLREPRPEGFPLLFSSDMHGHAAHRACSCRPA